MLQGPLTGLTEADRRLMGGLYWQGRSEADMATELGISQPAVNRRKRSIIQRLHRSIEAVYENSTDFGL